jgi:oligoendopeptidase F
MQVTEPVTCTIPAQRLTPHAASVAQAVTANCGGRLTLRATAATHQSSKLLIIMTRNQFPAISILTCLASSLMVTTSSAQDYPLIEWDLSPLVRDVAQWEAEYEPVLAEIRGLARHQTSALNDAASLENYLVERDTVRLRMARIASYASLQASTDARDPVLRTRSARIRNLWSELGNATSWFRPAVLAAGDAFVGDALASRPSLSEYRRELTQILESAPHTYSTETEQALAILRPVWGAAGTIYSTFINADFRWPHLTLSTGEEVTLSQTSIRDYRQLAHRGDRKRVFDTFWQAMRDFESTLGDAYYANVQAAVAGSRLRRHPSALAQALFDDRLPVAIYEKLISEVHHSLPELHRYMRTRDRLMRAMATADDPDYAAPFAYYDIYQPLIEVDRDFSFDASIELMRAAARPMGSEYQQLLNHGLDGRYMHVYPRPGKRGGAYMSSGVFGEHPYVFLNHNNTFDAASTLAHEWGHAIHSVLSQNTQPYPLARYSLFIAEIAAFTNEYLLLEHLQESAASDTERLFYYLQELEHYRGSFFRQAKFAEFELLAHSAVEANRPLTGQSLSRMYGQLLEQYYGHSEGVTQIDPAYHIEWSFIPHFYSNFYVYNYATSTAAARHFASAITAGDQAAQSAYLNLLRAGGSDDPHKLLERAGLDMHTDTAYRALRQRMTYLLDAIDQLAVAR